MVLLFPSTCFQSTIPVIILDIATKGRDDGGKAGGDDANNSDGQYASKRMSIDIPTESNPGNDGCSNCDLCKRSVRKRYQPAATATV